MPITLQELCDALEEICPAQLAYDWDNAGLQIGNPRMQVERVAVGLEVNRSFLAFAAARQCEALLVHHPLIFAPLRRVRYDSAVGELLAEIIEARRALIVAHTNLDRVFHGTASVLARIIDLADTRPLEPASFEQTFKFVVFVPPSHTHAIVEAIHRGGGGMIGNYSHCTFRNAGTGTYVPEIGANPYQGEIGQLEQAHEERLEAIVARHALPSVLREVIAAHPYEEVAYDVYPLQEVKPTAGLGLVGRLKRPRSLASLAEELAHACNADTVAIVGRPTARIRRVAIVTGSAGSTIDAVDPDTADLFITGELNYHRAVEAQARGLNVLTLGHAATEKVVVPHLIQLLRMTSTLGQKSVEFHAYTTYDDPLKPIVIAKGRLRSKKSTH